MFPSPGLNNAERPDGVISTRADHDAYLQVNVSYENMTPAESIQARLGSSDTTAITDQNGEAVFNLGIRWCGMRWVSVENPVYGGKCAKEIFDHINDNKTISIDHDPFAPVTRYSVSILSGIVSEEGYELEEGYSWNFTTASKLSNWGIFEEDPNVYDNKSVSVTLQGYDNMSVFMVIEGVGSFEIVRYSPGSYQIMIPGSYFDWDTEYEYNSSSRADGPDLDPDRTGSFRTPEKPGSSMIFSASVVVDEDKNWFVDVEAKRGIKIHIVIDGVDSFPLVEKDPGNYSARIDGTRFEWGKEYSYHFSETSEGGDPPGYEVFSGKRTMPEEPSGEDNTSIVPFIVGVSTIIIITAIVFVFLFIRKRHTGPEE